MDKTGNGCTSFEEWTQKFTKSQAWLDAMDKFHGLKYTYGTLEGIEKTVLHGSMQRQAAEHVRVPERHLPVPQYLVGQGPVRILVENRVASEQHVPAQERFPEEKERHQPQEDHRQEK